MGHKKRNTPAKAKARRARRPAAPRRRRRTGTQELFEAGFLLPFTGITFTAVSRF